MRDNSSPVFVAFIAALALGFSFAGCNCGGGGSEDAGEDAGPCVDAGETCTTGGAACCGAALCLDSVCTATCKDPGVQCSAGSECCFAVCGTDGTCGDACNAIGEGCTTGNDCCTGNCDGTTCRDITGRPTQPDGGSICDVRGSACTTDGECCSRNCLIGPGKAEGYCAPAYTCNAYNDTCGRDLECCSGSCSVNDGGIGFCQTISGSGGVPGCFSDGNPCADGNDCCTEVCLDLGSGTPVCQPVSGCQVAGNPCSGNAACCGGAPVGTVVCEGGGLGELGGCDQGQACRAPGSICGAPMSILLDGGHVCEPDPQAPGTCLRVPSETNCCGEIKQGNDDVTCRLDRSGVPRCFGQGDAGLTVCPVGYTGIEPCCSQTGQYCDFRDQCCNGAACAVGADGGRQCLEGPTCIALGGSCDPNASQCCTGTSCLPASELTFACQRPAPDGGTFDAGTCTANGGTCSTGATCCSGICNNGTCVPEGCQPQGGSCSVTADCCTQPPLFCDVPVGGGAGTCQPSSTTCPQLGQSCSPANPCCNEGQSLACTSTSSGASCDGTTACICEWIIP